MHFGTHAAGIGSVSLRLAMRVCKMPNGYRHPSTSRRSNEMIPNRGLLQQAVLSIEFVLCSACENPYE